jgi:hypothetical protein
MEGRRTWLLLAIPVAVVAVGLGGFALVSNRQERRLERAVPGFACADLRVETSSASWRWSGRPQHAASALYMPEECRARLEQMVASGGRFTKESCGIVSQCWSRSIGGERFQLEFTGDRVTFRFSRS